MQLPAHSRAKHITEELKTLLFLVFGFNLHCSKLPKI